MTKQTIDNLQPGTLDGDSLYDTAQKINENFNEIYTHFGDGQTLDNGYVGLKGLNAGLIVSQGLNTYTSREIKSLNSSIQVTNGTGAQGDPTLELSETGVLPAGSSPTLYADQGLTVDVHGRITALSTPTLLTTASAQATAASGSASTASTQATNAANSATAAANSATTAANDVATISTSLSQAATHATNAGNSATAAATSETNSATSATTATAQVALATTQAGNASTSATDASNSASAAATSATNASSSATAAATSATNAANSLASMGSNVTQAQTAATNAANSFDAFDDIFLGAKSSAPTVDNDGDALQTGALYFNTASDTMFVRTSGGSWTAAGSAVNGTTNRSSYVATANQTTFASTYDVGYLDVYLNGIKLSAADFTANNGTSFVLASGASVGDQVDAIGYGAFSVANVYTKTESDTLLAAKATTADLATTNTTVATKAPLASPNFSGTPQIGGVNIATTASIPAATTGMSGDFVASGTIGNKATVILNANGTVTAVAGTATSTGSSAVFASNTNVNNQTTYMLTGYYDDNVNKVVVLYSDNTDNNYLKAVVGTVSGTSISFTSPQQIHGDHVQFIDCDFLNYVGSWAFGVVVYKTPNNNQRLYARHLQLASNGTITVGSHTMVYSGVMSWSTVCANPAQNGFTVVYEDENNNRYGTANLIYMNGNGISGIGTPAVIWSGAMWKNNLVFAKNTSDTSKQCHICFSQYYNTSNGQSTLVIVPFHVSSSLAITQGTATFTSDTALHGTSGLNYIDAASFGNGRAAYCVTKDNGDGTNDVYAQMVEATSTQVIAQGSGSAGFTKVQDDAELSRIVYNANVNKIGVTYKNDSGTQPRPYYIRYGSATSSSLTGFSGSGITWDSHAQINGASENFARIGMTHDSTTNQDVVIFYDTGASSNDQNGRAKTVSPPSTNSGNGFIGISDAAISDTATGKVTVSGGLVTGLSGLTAKSDYYVQDDGSLATTVTAVKAGYALNATQMLLYGIEA